MNPFAELLASPPPLPIVAALDDLQAREATGDRHNLVISAPPGSGKTTLVPPALAGGGKVLVIQPRRVVARAGARRISTLLGEDVGNRVGFRVRGETRSGRFVEMVTPGVALRMLHADAELAGISTVIVDEVHERELDTDLALAFLLDVKETLRPDLRIVAMSATLAATQFAQLLAGEIVDVPGEIYPVTEFDRTGPQALGATNYGIAVRREFLQHVAGVVRDARESATGGILVFLPGVREIEKVAELLRDLKPQILHGQQSAAAQDRVLAAENSSNSRIVLATSIAESALTLPGVNTVVDSGLAREPRFDAATGIGGLVTVHANRARMTQRAGRAGREGPGRVFRCLSFARAVEFGEPEIHTADVTDATLQAAAWGAPDMAQLRLLDLPKPAASAAAHRTLHYLGAVTDSGQITSYGRELMQIPVQPPLARALLTGAEEVGPQVAAQVVAFLNLGVRIPDADLSQALRRERNRAELKEQTRRLNKLVSGVGKKPQRAANSQPVGDAAAAAVVALAYPQWLACRRGKNYLLANGTGAVLPPGSPLQGTEWLAVADLGRGQGRADAQIYAAVPISAAEALAAGAGLVQEETEISGDRGELVRRLGAIELHREPVKLTAAQLAEARMAEIRRTGLSDLPWSAAAQTLRQRLAFLHSELGEPWPDVSDEQLLAQLPNWLAPQLTKKRPDMLAALRNLLPWPEATRLDELAPERIATPVGSARVDYSTGKPRVRVRLQEVFGWARTPRLAGVLVTLELLSPASRPVAVTDDLASFWAGPYSQVRAEMRGRYPRHPWPEDPLTAQPTRRAKPKNST